MAGKALKLQATTRVAAVGDWTLHAVLLFGDASVVHVCIASGAQAAEVHVEEAVHEAGNAVLKGVGLAASGDNVDVELLRFCLSRTPVHA